MDTEGPMLPYAIPTPTFLGKSAFVGPLVDSGSPNNYNRKMFGFAKALAPSLEEDTVNGLFGTPWKSSIVANATSDCVFMPFWEWQIRLMEGTLQGFQILEDTCNYMESPSGQHRMVTLTASSDEYRYIRMTYLDGGDKVQIFTSVWYPRGNFPLFGMDALQFQSGKRNLAICDFQPIHSKEEDHDAMYEDLLGPIRNLVPDLQDEMTDRFFDPSRYFSNHTLLGRFQNTQDPQEAIWDQLWPAYKSYLQTHIQMVQRKPRTTTPTLSPEQVLEHHRAYDNYVAECDPACPMFSSIFGIDVAEAYVYDVLFPLATKPESSHNVPTIP
jgi:15,16-dihydrobiliverdin:ferredoxin oxidoreductase